MYRARSIRARCSCGQSRWTTSGDRPGAAGDGGSRRSYGSRPLWAFSRRCFLNTGVLPCGAHTLADWPRRRPASRSRHRDAPDDARGPTCGVSIPRAHRRHRPGPRRLGHPLRLPGAGATIPVAHRAGASGAPGACRLLRFRPTPRPVQFRRCWCCADIDSRRGMPDCFPAHIPARPHPADGHTLALHAGRQPPAIRRRGCTRFACSTARAATERKRPAVVDRPRRGT